MCWWKAFRHALQVGRSARAPSFASAFHWCHCSLRMDNMLIDFSLSMQKFPRNWNELGQKTTLANPMLLPLRIQLHSPLPTANLSDPPLPTELTPATARNASLCWTGVRDKTILSQHVVALLDRTDLYLIFYLPMRQTSKLEKVRLSKLGSILRFLSFDAYERPRSLKSSSTTSGIDHSVVIAQTFANWTAKRR